MESEWWNEDGSLIVKINTVIYYSMDEIPVLSIWQYYCQNELPGVEKDMKREIWRDNIQFGKGVFWVNTYAFSTYGAEMNRSHT